MHGDTVFARCVGGERGDEGEVYSIVSRGYSEIVGTYFKEKKGGYVQPDERRFFNDVRVAGSKVRAYSGEKVLIKILDYPEGGEPVGEITEVLGQSGDLSCEEDAIIRSKNLAEEFPHKALAEAKRVSAEKVEVGGRRDFRDRLIITIDGDDSRDFDDAVEVWREGKYYRLACISRTSRTTSAAAARWDTEAYKRGTMRLFPRQGAPHAARGTFQRHLFFERGGRSLHALVSDEDRRKGQSQRQRDCDGRDPLFRAHDLIKRGGNFDGDRELTEKYEFLLPMLEEMRQLAEILMKKRKSRGSIDIDVKEAAVTVRTVPFR